MDASLVAANRTKVCDKRPRAAKGEQNPDHYILLPHESVLVASYSILGRLPEPVFDDDFGQVLFQAATALSLVVTAGIQ
jgi:hypothetical protein